ncbi:MAG: Stp1/IreP family PP2C-type Ser/Thr phosphatase [Planctomycetes bacterium]|nr:Stp1/IreP family PP2C-type Ser/Thr phosphatase [Planctomycetota bacterium]
MPHTDAGFKDGVMVVRMVTATDVGLQRKNNEDSCALIEEAGLCVVADGMGGHLGGEIASNIAIEAVTEAFKDRPRNGQDERKDAELLSKCIKSANKEIYRRGNADAALKNMGTTIVAAVLAGDYIVTANVGDSRIYRVRDKKLEQVTEDHSWVGELRKKNLISEEDARSHPLKNIITRALGMEPSVEVDVKWEKARSGDLYLLCTDGLTDLVPDGEIAEKILSSGDDLDAMARALIETANAAGGTDNITVGLCRVE